jgi:hypothetical protein
MRCPQCNTTLIMGGASEYVDEQTGKSEHIGFAICSNNRCSIEYIEIFSSDTDRNIFKTLVERYPNDMELGQAIRHLYNEANR